jgi:protoporphyrinogen oxidase
MLNNARGRFMKLIIIGAGVSGLAAAYTINQQAPLIALHCIEKSRGLGGRAATQMHL